MSRVTDEAMRRNVHNPFHDSITTASTKLMQRKAYDVISEAQTNLTTVTSLGDGEAFAPNTDRSLVDPTKDIMIIVNTTIERKNVGGRFDTIDMNQSTDQIY